MLRLWVALLCVALGTAKPAWFLMPRSGGSGYGIGSTPPGPQVPFDCAGDFIASTNEDSNHFGGYYYYDDYIRRFTHTHLVGAGLIDYGNIGVMPVPDFNVALLSPPFYARALFSHNAEVVQPGYYSVLLQDTNIFAELTATQYVGVHRYTFPAGAAAPTVMFDVSAQLGDGACINSTVLLNGSASGLELSGWVQEQGQFSGGGGIFVYFVARLNATGSSFGTWNDQTISPGTTSTAGQAIGGYVQFAKSSSAFAVEVYVAISFISVAQARANLMNDLDPFTPDLFNTIQNETQSLWEYNLGAIQVLGGTMEQQETFYTALYHNLQSPTTFSEAGGFYRGLDNQVHSLKNGTERYFTDLSIWDIFRTQLPLLAFWQPVIFRDVVRSIVSMYEQYGGVPTWPFAYIDTGVMSGSHVNVIVSHAIAMGITDFDLETIYEGLKAQATTQVPHNARADIGAWLEYGFIPYSDDIKDCTSLTLEYAYDDWALSRIAGYLNNTADEATFLGRSSNYRNAWDTKMQFFCPRPLSNDSTPVFQCPKLLNDGMDNYYQEGDAWHYRWFAPQNMTDLVQLMGGTDNFVAQANFFFDASTLDPSNLLPNPYYWAGNEPDIQAPYIFNYAGRPDLTQKWVRILMDTRYSNRPEGLPGNDDFGTLSSWYAWSSLGIFPLPGSTTFLLGSPVFDKVSISRPQGQVTIVAYNATIQNIYVQRAAVNGVALTQPFIDYSQISGAATIECWMGSDPQPNL